MLTKNSYPINMQKWKRTFLVLFSFLFSFLFQAKKISAQNAVASFSVSGSTSGCAPLNIQFTNSSLNATSYFWDFGNGNTSTLANPTIVYINSGNYTVKLVAYGSNGSADSLTKNNYISAVQKPTANFIATITATCLSNQITFSNLTQNYDSCLWDFGDGITSDVHSPVHTYTAPGQFNVTLIAYKSSFGCSDVITKNQYITIHPAPTTNFTANQTSTCTLTQLFSFSSTSANANSWLWNFGDGTTSTLQNPNHTYSTQGTYTVSLITGNTFGCSNTLTRNNYIQVLDNPEPQISVTASSGCTPLNVQFSTTASAAFYSWNFGDGTLSSLQNPYHAYNVAGSFPVSINVTYSNGCSNSNVFNSMNVSMNNLIIYYLTNNTGCSPLAVQFHNGGPAVNSYLWDFGDGTTSTQLNPVHTYISNGTYVTSLTTTNAAGCTSVFYYSQPVTVAGPDATFNANVYSGCPPLNVNFACVIPDLSYQYNWNFGDGTTSNQIQPNHSYTSSGNYTVSLTVSNSSGCSVNYTMPAQISVNNAQSNFTPPDTVTACAPFNVNFSDASPGVSSWLWNFGDGSSSSLQNPSHTYTTAGLYNVSLNTGNNGSGCDQIIPVYSTYIIHGGASNFSYHADLCPPYTAYFHDSSTNAISWLWNFGDGTISTQQNPVHIYANPGSYSVSLTITTSDGCTYTSTHNYAVNFTPLVAAPFASTTDSIPPLNVQFIANSSGATQWLWDFGDGTTSTLQNPIHIFTTPPPYTISLTISNDSCSITLDFPNVEIGAGGIPLDPDSVIIHQPEPQQGCAPFSLYFHNPSLNAISWLWNFGDGTTSTLENPTHVFANPGIYDITLITHDAAGSIDTMYLPASVVANGISADFTISHVNNCIGNSINLQSNASNVASYAWNFGDGNTSPLSNPSHVYTNNNMNYVISLSITDSSGCSDFQTKTFYGSVNNAISSDKRFICGSDTVLFNSSILNYATYQWDFGDSVYSSLANPFHVYTDSGTYHVVLHVSDTSGCTQSFSLPYTIVVSHPVAQFEIANVNSNCTGVTYYFNNTSLNSDFWLWDFHDGTTTTLKNPGHYYVTPGYHPVTLTAYKNQCSSSITFPDTVYIPNRSANFSFLKNSDCLPITVDFTDSSTDASTWHWDFGDGTTSTLQNPSHTYTTKPLNNVTLNIYDVYGCNALKTKIVVTPTIAAASLDYIQGCSPMQVAFADSSLNAVSWLWDFGDGTNSANQNPVHIYNGSGYFNVQLIVSSQSGCHDTLNIDSLVMVGGPSASFTSDIEGGCAPAIIDFTDSSLNATNYLWNFGDSSYSTSKNPSHIYSIPGNYSVTLAVTDSVGCTDTIQENNLVTIRGPVASFSISGNGGCIPYTVQFTNASTNVSDWFWSFGDGDSSAALNPVHEFTNPGNYVVSLITHDSTGCEAIYTYPDTIHIYAAPVASFNISDSIGCSALNVSFTNSSANGTSYQWNFGDGTISTQNAPVHNYSLPGIYNVLLITTAQGGCSDTLNFPNAIQVYEKPVADFVANVTEGCAPLNVGFTSQTSGTQNATFLWDFGNGFTSTLENPLMVFNTPGTYTVTLTVTNSGICSDIKTKTAYIRVYENSPPSIAEIRGVTVTSNTSVDITWANVADPDLYQYSLFRLNNFTGIYDNIYTVIDTNGTGFSVTTTYTDTGLNTLSNVYTYKVQTLDHCGNKIDLSNLTAHTTMNVTAIAVNKNISVSWTPYIGCIVNDYEIYRKDNNGNFNLIASVPSAANSFIDSTISCPVEYSYKIKALALCGTTYFSFSDTSNAIPESDLGNQFIDVVFSTVEDDKNVLTEWNPPQIAPDKVVRYDIYRSTDQINYTLSGSVPESELKFIDEDVDVHHQNYFYKIIIINTCDIETMQGKIGSSILLNSEYNEADETVNLRWTKYEYWNTGVDKYVIERKAGNGAWETFKIVDGQTLETKDK
ncbi:MAG: PKD domain-containing protein [Bacteroidota bacterium]